MSKINIFKAEMFDAFDSPEAIACSAQQIIDDYIAENGVKVWGAHGKQYCYTDYKSKSDTHTAILLDIQPLKECEHKEAVYVEDQDKTWFKCRDCGKPVKAKGWETCENN